MKSSARGSSQTQEGPPSIQELLDRHQPLRRQVWIWPRSVLYCATRMSDRYLQSLGDTDKVGERRRTHFCHYVPSMQLQRDLTDTQCSGSLLVEKTAHHERQDVTFAWRQVAIALPQRI